MDGNYRAKVETTAAVKVKFRDLEDCHLEESEIYLQGIKVHTVLQHVRQACFGVQTETKVLIQLYCPVKTMHRRIWLSFIYKY